MQRDFCDSAQAFRTVFLDLPYPDQFQEFTEVSLLSLNSVFSGCSIRGLSACSRMGIEKVRLLSFMLGSETGEGILKGPVRSTKPSMFLTARSVVTE